MLFSVSASSTWHSTFVEDLGNYRAAGVDGIGLWEFKLTGPDGASVTALHTSGLRPTICWPRVPGPLTVDPLFPGPRRAQDRTAMLCASIRRLAVFEPLAVACLAEGDLGGRTVAEARAVVVSSLREAAVVAGEVGVRLALEVIRPGPGANLSTTITDALGLIDDIGVDTIDILIDTWHFWDSPVAPEEIARHGGRVIAVQVNDFPVESRGWYDRALPGSGVMPLPAILAALEASGFGGPYELELFSDDGPLGTRDPRSFAVRHATQFLAQAREGFANAWQARSAAPTWRMPPGSADAT